MSLQQMAKAKDSNSRVMRWFLLLQDFSFQVEHQAGMQNGTFMVLSLQYSWLGPWGKRVGGVGVTLAAVQRLGSSKCSSHGCSGRAEGTVLFPPNEKIVALPLFCTNITHMARGQDHLKLQHWHALISHPSRCAGRGQKAPRCSS